MSSVHEVRSGECLSSIARSYGYPDWRKLYDHPANAELKRRRPNPNHLLPGDLVAIPDPITKQESRATGTWHDFAVEREEPLLRMRLYGPKGDALAGQQYTLNVSGNERVGTTDGNGVFEEPIPLGVKSVVLKTKVSDDAGELEQSFRLMIGNLDPISEVTGIQARLRNLGLFPGAVDGNYNSTTRAALAAFQSCNGLEVTGVADQATLDALEKRCDLSP